MPGLVVQLPTSSDTALFQRISFQIIVVSMLHLHIIINTSIYKGMFKERIPTYHQVHFLQSLVPTSGTEVVDILKLS